MFYSTGPSFNKMNIDIPFLFTIQHSHFGGELLKGTFFGKYVATNHWGVQSFWADGGGVGRGAGGCLPPAMFYGFVRLGLAALVCLIPQKSLNFVVNEWKTVCQKWYTLSTNLAACHLAFSHFV
jgi:hypothetical protein